MNKDFIKIINLKHRTDRKESIINEFKNKNVHNYNFIDGVYGTELKLTNEIINIFKDNDFGSRKSFIGCALTHYYLWKDLVNDEINNYYVILEDDITLSNNFMDKINTLKNNFEKDDLIFLGYHMYSRIRTQESIKNIYDIESENINIMEFNKDFYIGGTFSYSINKNGAQKLLDYIKNNGIKHGIDYMMKMAYIKSLNENKLNVLEIQPFIVFSDWAEMGTKIDSDIQFNFDCFDINSYLLSMNELSFKYKLDKNIAFGHDYIPIYDNLFNNIRENVKNLLEIGIGCVETGQMTHVIGYQYKTGNSLRFWRDYFYNADIVGVDIYNEALFKEDRIETYQCDQSDINSLNNLINITSRKFDIIIDDGSHHLPHQITSFIELEKTLTDNGIYIIEDVFNNYFEPYKNLSFFNDEYKKYIINKYDITLYDRQPTSSIKGSSCLVVFKRKNIDNTIISNDNYVYVNSDNHYGLGNSMFQIAVASYYCEKYGYKLFLNENSEWLKYGTGNMFNKNQAKLNYLDTIFKNLNRKNNTSDYNEVITNDCYSLNFSQIVNDTNNNNKNHKILINGWSHNIDLFYEVKDKLFNYFYLEDIQINQYLDNKYKLNNDDINLMIGIRIGYDGGFRHGNKFINKYSYTKIIDNIIDENKQNNKKINIFIIGDSTEFDCLIDLKYNPIFISENDIYQFYFGLKCNYFILSDSTFHYWITLLACIRNPNKKVYYLNNTDISNKKYISEKLIDEFKWIKVEPLEDMDFVFIKGFDQINYDIHFMTNTSVPIMKKHALNNSSCIGFNTLGYFKNNFQSLEKSQYFNENDGIYIKKDIYNKVMNINNNDNKIYNIKLLSNYSTSEKMCKQWNFMSQGDFKWNNLKLTSEDYNVDYYVIINKPQRNSFYIPEKSIIFQMEPWVYDTNKHWGVKSWGYWANPDPSQFLYVSTHKKDLNNCGWEIDLTYNYLNNNIIKKKYDNVLSTICTDKDFDDGHKLRINFFKFLDEKENKDFEFDVWGKINLTHPFKNNKGQLLFEDKKNGIIPYKYYILFENNNEDNYISEKLWEPIISECLCFYIGAPNVLSYINEEAIIILDPNDYEKNFQIINDAIENDLWSKKINKIREEKYKILNYYNFFPRLERILTSHIYSDKINLIKNNSKFFINILNPESTYKINIFKKTIEDLGIQVSYMNNENDYLHFLTQELESSSNISNYIIINQNNLLNISLMDFIEYLYNIPDNYDICYLYQDEKIEIGDQKNKYYFDIENNYLNITEQYILSNKAIEKIILNKKDNLNLFSTNKNIFINDLS